MFIMELGTPTKDDVNPIKNGHVEVTEFGTPTEDDVNPIKNDVEVMELGMPTGDAGNPIKNGYVDPNPNPYSKKKCTTTTGKKR